MTNAISNNIIGAIQFFGLILPCFAFPTLAQAQMLNPAVNEDTIEQTICASGYIEAIQPPNDEIKERKAEMILAQGEDETNESAFSLDHIIPLSLGGAALDISNTELIDRDDAQKKSRFEVKLHCLVCNGQIKLSDAQKIILVWEDASKRLEKKVCVRK